MSDVVLCFGAEYLQEQLGRPSCCYEVWRGTCKKPARYGLVLDLSESVHYRCEEHAQEVRVYQPSIITRLFSLPPVE